MSDDAKILVECQETLKRGRAVATGIGVFTVVINKAGNPLLRKRIETDSLFQEDLSGKWELIGGGVEIAHFMAEIGPEEQRAIFACLAQKLMEEAGLKLIRLPQPLMVVPDWILAPYPDKKILNQERIVIDLAFATPIVLREKYLEKTKEFDEKFKRRELMFVPQSELSKIDMVDQRTRNLIDKTLKAFYLNRAFVLLDNPLEKD